MRTLNEKKAAGKHALEVASYKTLFPHIHDRIKIQTQNWLKRERRKVEREKERTALEIGNGGETNGKHLKTTLLNITPCIASNQNMEKAVMHV